MPRLSRLVTSFLIDQKTCLENLSEKNEQLIQIIDVLIRARDNRKKIITMGNGGSGSTASHFASDLLKTAIVKNKKRFEAISLVDNVPVLLAWANDTSYGDVFEQQIKNFVSKNDVVIAFSGSGNSPNVINALKFARKVGAICIGFTGAKGGKFPRLCDITVKVPSNDMLAIESAHVVLCHCIISTLRQLGKPMFSYE